MSRVVGRFYFRQTINGNLVGEYSNEGGSHAFPECAYLIADGECRDNAAAFLGDYRTTWIEDPGLTNEAAALTVALKSSSSKLYQFTWSDLISHNILFQGEAMLAEAGLLVGNYTWVGDD